VSAETGPAPPIAPVGQFVSTAVVTGWIGHMGMVFQPASDRAGGEECVPRVMMAAPSVGFDNVAFLDIGGNLLLRLLKTAQGLMVAVIDRIVISQGGLYFGQHGASLAHVG